MVYEHLSDLSNSFIYFIKTDPFHLYTIILFEQICFILRLWTYSLQFDDHLFSCHFNILVTVESLIGTSI